MKKQLYPILFLLVCAQLAAQSITSVIQNDLEQNRISLSDALYYRAARFFAPELLPETYRQYQAGSEKCGTVLMHEIRSHMHLFTRKQQEFLGKVFARPSLPHDYVSPSGLFRIHYTTTGNDGVSAEDYDGSGVPDYIEETAISFDYSYHVEVETLGFRRPPADDIDGGQWDVYIKDLSGMYGYTSYSGNPGSWITYVVIDNDFSETNTKGVHGMRVTAAHEFNHVIQFGYVFRDEDIFLMEASATWMEDVVYDRVNDYLYYLDYYFRNENYAFNYANGIREYGLCLWFHFLEDRFQDKQLVPRIWEAMVDYPAVDALQEVLPQYSTSFEDELALFYTWNATTGPQADTSRFYPEGNLYPVPRPGHSWQVESDTSFSVFITGTGAGYYKLSLDSGLQYMLVPVNTRRTLLGTADSARIDLTEYNTPLFKSIPGGAAAAITGKEPHLWQCGAVLLNDDDHSVLDAVVLRGSDTPESKTGTPFPNPFIPEQHASITLPFVSDASGDVWMKIFTPSGAAVYTSMKNSIPGIDYFIWNGKGPGGEILSSGVYMYVIYTQRKILHRGAFALVR